MDRREKSSRVTDRADGVLEGVERGIMILVRTVRLPRVRRTLGADSASGLDRTSHLLLARLETSGPSRLSALAEELAVDVSTLSRQVALAEERRLVERSPDDSDGRAMLLSLSPRGAKTLARVRKVRLATLAHALGDWQAEDLERFADLLERCSQDLLRNAQEVEPPARPLSAGREARGDSRRRRDRARKT